MLRKINPVRLEAECNIPAGWGAWKPLKRLYFVLDIARVECGMADRDITGLKPAQFGHRPAKDAFQNITPVYGAVHGPACCACGPL